MKSCLMNKCCGDDIKAPCCLDCPNIDCPERCTKTSATHCVAVMEEKHDARRKGGVAVPATRTM